ncbi:DUF6946 family protein [Sulfitobacter sp. LC.270.F.C4]|uniref:DUF6946 family protein n=1 Tax=Sulfitobacter sp. LC.270.F.C4 TaxID=3079556 RepID=UPI00397FEDE1
MATQSLRRETTAAGRALRPPGLCRAPPGHLPTSRTGAALIEAHCFRTDAMAIIVQSVLRELRWFEDFANFFEAIPERNTARQIMAPAEEVVDTCLGDR